MKLESPDLAAISDSLIFSAVSVSASVFSVRTLICWICRELSILLSADAQTKNESSRSTLLKLIGSSTSASTPIMINLCPRSVIVLPIGSAVPKRELANLVPMTAVGVSESSRRKTPFLRLRFWILRKSGFVPITVADGTVVSVSPLSELTDIASGETAATPSIFLIVSISFKVKLDLRYCVDVVSSETIESTVERVEVGRITMRLEPTLETCSETRLVMLPMSESIKIMEATPMEIPRQVRKERVRLRLSDDFASS